MKKNLNKSKTKKEEKSADQMNQKRFQAKNTSKSGHFYYEKRNLHRFGYKQSTTSLSRRRRSLYLWFFRERSEGEKGERSWAFVAVFGATNEEGEKVGLLNRFR